MGLYKNYLQITTIFSHLNLLPLEKTQASYRLNTGLDEVIVIFCLAAIGDIVNVLACPQGSSPCPHVASHFVGRSSSEGCCRLVFSSLLMMVRTNQLQLHHLLPSRALQCTSGCFSLRLCWEQVPWVSGVLGLTCSGSPADCPHLFPALHSGTSCW